MNKQAIEKKTNRPDNLLEVHSIFHTIQGEGPFCGHSAIFIRLAGCNLQCPLCDTDYTSRRTILDPFIILARCTTFATKGLIVISGGEPFRQNISTLVNTLVDFGYYVQIETNGTLEPSFGVEWSKKYWERKGAYIVCSPKTGKINALVEQAACAFKYVVNHDSVYEDGLPIHALGHGASPMVARVTKLYNKPIYIQPADNKDELVNSANLQCAITSAQKFGYILQVQVHKLINME